MVLLSGGVRGEKHAGGGLLATAVGLAGGAWLAWKSASRGALARCRAIRPMCAGLLFPPLFYFGVSMTSGINLGMRHILPVYPFLYVGAAALMARFTGGRHGAWGGRAARLAPIAMAALGLLQAAECARIAPDYLAYFNPLAGGPGNGPHYLVDSNIDWGQDVKKLVKWLDAHGTRRARVYYFGTRTCGTTASVNSASPARWTGKAGRTSTNSRWPA